MNPKHVASLQKYLCAAMPCETVPENTVHLGAPQPHIAHQQKLRTLISDRVTDLDAEAWNGLVNHETIYLRTDYLAALEAGLTENFKAWYASFYRGEALIGVAAFQLVSFESGNISSNFSTRNRLLRWTTKNMRQDSTLLRFPVLVCGNAFATGEHGFRFCPSVPQTEQAEWIESAIGEIRSRCRAQKQRISALMIKDFYQRTSGVARALERFRYASFKVDPNMLMPVRAEWETFEHYLDALNSKFRTKARSALKKSAGLEARFFDLSEFRTHRADFKRLYEEVYYRADFRMGKLGFEAFAEFFERMESDYFLRAYFFEGKMVAFQSGFCYNGVLDAHFVGIDYAFNYTHAIYPRMLYDYIRVAIERRCEKITFGRTAMEIKTTVGAFPVDLEVFIKHRFRVPNALMAFFFRYVKPSEYAVRSPYKQNELNDLPTVDYH